MTTSDFSPRLRSSRSGVAQIRSPRCISTCVLALGLALPSVTLAAPPSDTAAPKMNPVRTIDDALVLEPGASCLVRETLLDDIRGWRGKDSPVRVPRSGGGREMDRVDPRVVVRVRGSSDDPRVSSFAVWVGEELVVERSFDLDPSDCANVHAVVSLAISIALDDSLPVELGIIDGPAKPVEQMQPGEGDVPEFDEDPTPTPSRRRTALALTLAGAAFVEVTPRLSGGALLSFDVRPRDHFDVRFGALATHLPNFALDVGEVDVSIAAGRLDLCWGSSPGRVRVRLCGGAAAGALLAAGHGYSVDFRRSLPYFAALIGADLSVRLIGPLAVEMRVEGVFPLQRAELDVRSTTGQLLDRERLGPLGMLVALGPRFEF